MSAVQTLKLDARRRAMLDEMGVKVWWPMPEAVEAAPVAAEAKAVVAEPLPVDEREPYVAEAPVVPVAPPAHAPAARPTAAQPPMARPAAAPLAHGAAVLVEAPRRLYAEAGAGPGQGGWLVVADMPPEADGHGEPFAGDAGKLLDNMLRALKLHDGKTPVHLMRTHRGVAAGQPGSPRPMAEAFEEHAAALAPTLVLAMGPLAAQSLMQSADPLGKLRGRAVPLPSVGGVPVVATYHPAYLLRNPADKARAWADLCLAAEQQTPSN
ncbi:uracil-DNA glycosylase family 4 [Variovorax paradoxus]|uniref:uracil-DNA glycosylase family protein n=1 Tax=Variovorax paradoxus TaxID=34073 RepID=UPI00278CE445|nr:uracil-DNA glycosylase family protein [Variovorax paradoxus]MDQ0573456.1 uracil-DNA glycosylase family 4 [Variovorax paradoxus]